MRFFLIACLVASAWGLVVVPDCAAQDKPVRLAGDGRLGPAADEHRGTSASYGYEGTPPSVVPAMIQLAGVTGNDVIYADPGFHVRMAATGSTGNDRIFGGSGSDELSGGVGMDKACSMPRMFSERDLAVFARLRGAFDPEGLCNPGKVVPTPRLCGEVPGPYRVHALERIGVAERL